MDELDYMGEKDYGTVSMIAGERGDIGITASSTPTGQRSVFYKMCVEPDFGYSAHHHPSMDNPNWDKVMEERYRAELTEAEYEHEILAEFGSEDAGVFNKERIDEATRVQYYTYEPLTSIQQNNVDVSIPLQQLFYTTMNPAPSNPLRCMGVNLLPLKIFNCWKLLRDILTTTQSENLNVNV